MKKHYDLIQEREKTEGVDRGMFCGKVGTMNTGKTGNGNNVNAVGIAKFKGTCNKCGKQGHKGKDCWENEANADKRPSWWQPGTRQIGVRGTGGGGGNSNNGGRRFQRKCYKCGSTDHIRKDCPQLARNQNNVNNANTGR